TQLAAANDQITNIRGNQIPATQNIGTPSSTSNNICGTTNFPVYLIYGGKKNTPGSWPWLVPIFKRKQSGEQKYICGGNIIAPHAIITAAHCVIDNGRVNRAQDVLIGLGIYNIFNWNQPYTHISRASRIIPHPEYSVKSIYDADIALIFLDKSYSYNHLIRPVCIWSGSSDLNYVINRNGRVAGWGQSKISGGRVAEPSIINAQIVSSEKCLRSNEAFSSITTSRNFCAGYRDGKGPCKGDSGSGLMMDLAGRWHLRGIVSGSLQHAVTTCDLREYVVYTDVAQFINWIHSYIR
ncbi:serine protease gd-like, partial [Condylostylus longicornis]|uniref:serine protease gd-like n=1 Tax=Condylostylus longicornis TaxID=2530218 RepID=UPI00244DA089